MEDLNGHFTYVDYSLPLDEEGPETIITSPDLSGNIYFSRANYATGPIYVEGVVTDLSSVDSFAYYIRSNKTADPSPDIILFEDFENDIFDADGSTFHFLVNGNTTGSLDLADNDAELINTINNWTGNVMTITLIVTGNDDLETRPIISAIEDIEGPTVYVVDNISTAAFPVDSVTGRYLLKEGDAVVLTATFEDDYSGLYTLTAPVVSIGSFVADEAMTEDTELVWTYNLSIPSGNDGTADINVLAYDGVGNPNDGLTSSSVAGYIIDNTAPIVVVSGTDDFGGDRISKAGDTVSFTAVFTELDEVDEDNPPRSRLPPARLLMKKWRRSIT